jgi:hypothetical protein
MEITHPHPPSGEPSLSEALRGTLLRSVYYGGLTARRAFQAGALPPICVKISAGMCPALVKIKQVMLRLVLF